MALPLRLVRPEPLPVAVPVKVMLPAWLTENLLEPLTCRSVRVPLNPPAVLTFNAVPVVRAVPKVERPLKPFVPVKLLLAFRSATLLER